MIEIELPFLTPLANKILRMHWTAKSAMNKRVREHILHQISPPKTLNPPVSIHVTRHSKQEPDPDGLPICAKPIIDAFVYFGIIPDDNPAIVKKLVVDWEYAPGNGFITASIDEMDSKQ